MPEPLRAHYPALPAVLAAVLVVAGCGSDRPGSGQQIEVGSTINYGSFGTKADIDCGQGKSLNIGGSNNTLTVRGNCASVSVGGADNAITIARIDGTLSVVGLNNTVTYQDGDPEVDDSGTGNRVTRGSVHGRH
jgi:hypothetical protein